MTARAQRRMLNEVKKNPRVSARDLKKSLAHANISVDESTIRKTLNKNGVHGRTPRRKPLLSRKNIAARLKFAKEHLDVPQHYWQNILWTDETKVEFSSEEESQESDEEDSEDVEDRRYGAIERTPCVVHTLQLVVNMIQKDLSVKPLLDRIRVLDRLFRKSSVAIQRSALAPAVWTHSGQILPY
ncbi:hypothetical protein JOQ06_009165 [Pogonophryne albipinna]|uniref:Transposase Tc1-like domain-containing protein n=2 Tax=Pogonophryne albipinna TaxID=1090488 RepID=A0AAD6BQK5_9TELE|nr:hypothetical protein JOQ06_009165 [Pogonophryne albipinna]